MGKIGDNVEFRIQLYTTDVKGNRIRNGCRKEIGVVENILDKKIHIYNYVVSFEGKNYFCNEFNLKFPQ